MSIEKDSKFFWSNIESLYKKYGHKFLVIKDENVIGVYDTFDNALQETLKTKKIGTFIVQECLESEEKATHYFQSNVIFNFKQSEIAQSVQSI